MLYGAFMFPTAYAIRIDEPARGQSTLPQTVSTHSTSSAPKGAHLAARRAAGEKAAISRARPNTSSRMCSEGMTCATSPIARARMASTLRPVSRSSEALARPTNAASRWISPQPGIKPCPTSGTRNAAFSDAIRRSKASARARPSPIA